MKPLYIITLAILLTGCGTARGALDGVGMVFNGMADDVRGVGQSFK